MDVLVDDYGGDIPLWEKIMDRQGKRVLCLGKDRPLRKT